MNRSPTIPPAFAASSTFNWQSPAHLSDDRLQARPQTRARLFPHRITAHYIKGATGVSDWSAGRQPVRAANEYHRDNRPVSVRREPPDTRGTDAKSDASRPPGLTPARGVQMQVKGKKSAPRPYCGQTFTRHCVRKNPTPRGDPPMDPIPCRPGLDPMIHQLAASPGIPVKIAVLGPWTDRSPLDRSEHTRRRAPAKPGLGRSRKAAVSLPDFATLPQAKAICRICNRLSGWRRFVLFEGKCLGPIRT